MLLMVALPSSAEGVTSLTSGWQYRWGDSPRLADGTLGWLRETEHDAQGPGWRDIDFPSNPPDRDGRRYVWYRIRLPEISTRDPALFIYSIDVCAELYLNGRLIYRWGEVEPEGKGRFPGWPWHLVELPLDAGGQQMLVRVASDYRDIGLWGSVLVGPRFELIAAMFARDMPRLVVAAVSVLLALALLGGFLVKKPRQPMTLYLGLATLSLALRVLSRCHVKQLILNQPTLWVHIADISIALIATFSALAIQEVIGDAFKKWTRAAWLVVDCVFAGGVICSAIGITQPLQYSLVGDVSLVLLLALLCACSFIAARRGNTDALIVTVATGAVGLLATYAIMVSNAMLPWTDEIDYLIMFVFMLGLCGLVARRVFSLRRQVAEYAVAIQAQSEQLKQANEELERKVEERTRELEQANKRLTDEKRVLQVVSITDSLTGVHNRMYILERLRLGLSQAHRYGEKLSIIMLDLDHFKDVNDTWGHQAGDDVLRRVSEVLKTTLRDSDLAGRYGGEEFLIILPKADATDAHLVAERIRSRVEALRVRAGEHRLTVSGGVAEYTGQSDETLLLEADRNLYRAKQGGRNRVEGASPPS